MKFGLHELFHIPANTVFETEKAAFLQVLTALKVAKCTWNMMNCLCCGKTHLHSHLPSTIVLNHWNHFMRKLIFSLLIIFHYSVAEE